MSKSYPVILLILLLVGSVFWWNTNHLSDHKTTSLEEVQESETSKSPYNWFVQQRAYPYGKVDRQAIHEARKYRSQALKKTNHALSKNGTDQWEFAGPTNVGGRITDIEMPAYSTDIIYAAAASGGIFKSTDAGDSWHPIFDDAESLAVGDMAIAPSNEAVIYVGTGEPNGGGGSLTYDGYGIYKTTDEGTTWQHLGLTEIGSVGKVVVDPRDENRVFVAAMGDLFANNSERGVYRTTDGGDTWKQVLFVSDSTGVVDLAINPDNPNIVYAAAWERVRRPSYNQYYGATSGIYRSIDGGDTWEELTNGLPSNPQQKGRISIAIAPSDPNILYASYVLALGTHFGNFKSTDGGDSWTTISDNGNIFNVSYMWWFGGIFVHPKSPDEIYFAGFNCHKSTDGGKIWRDLPTMHVDQHSVFIHPSQTDLVLFGNDGGIYKSTNSGTSIVKLNQLPITQFYSCEIDHSEPSRLYGGSQDNGTVRTLTGKFDDWNRILGGDGLQVLVTPDDNKYVYAETQYGGLFLSTNGGNNMYSVDAGINDNRRNWNSPIALDPNDSQTVYFGASRVFRSTNRAVNWTAISPDLTNGPSTGNLTYGTLTTIAISPADSRIIYAGTDDGNVWVSTNNGAGWNKISEDLPNRWITRVVAHPTDAATAYVTISGYRFGENIGHLYKTTNNGNTWTNISGDLPDVPVNDLIVNIYLEALYIATDIGVFVSNNEGNTWDLLGTDLPGVVVTDLDYHHPTRKLVAATFGRSMYSYQTESNVAVQTVNQLDFKLNISPNPSTVLANIQFTPNEKAHYKIAIFDALGKKTMPVFDGILNAEAQHFEISVSDFVAGTYYCRIQSKKGILTQAILVQ